jgi:hypothetical protein
MVVVTDGHGQVLSVIEMAVGDQSSAQYVPVVLGAAMSVPDTLAHKMELLANS